VLISDAGSLLGPVAWLFYAIVHPSSYYGGSARSPDFRRPPFLFLCQEAQKDTSTCAIWDELASIYTFSRCCAISWWFSFVLAIRGMVTIVSGI